MDIDVTWPRCECGHTAYDHDEDSVCAMAFLDFCYGYWPHGLRVSRGEMLERARKRGQSLS